MKLTIEGNPKEIKTFFNGLDSNKINKKLLTEYISKELDLNSKKTIKKLNK